MKDLLNKLVFFVEANSDKTIVYVAGKVTGLPYSDVYSKFKIRENFLKEKDYAVINPCDWIEKDCNWQDAMRKCIVLLSASQKVNLLSCWYQSPGATIEMELALKLGIERIYS